MISFCTDRDIIHQTSCPCSSQQNGVVEQKHHHLLDAAHTLLFHDLQVPKHFWGGFVLTACHLINRMPSNILNHKSLFSLLYPTRSPFPLTPLCV